MYSFKNFNDRSVEGKVVCDQPSCLYFPLHFPCKITALLPMKLPRFCSFYKTVFYKIVSDDRFRITELNSDRPILGMISSCMVSTQAPHRKELHWTIFWVQFSLKYIPMFSKLSIAIYHMSYCQCHFTFLHSLGLPGWVHT